MCTRKRKRVGEKDCVLVRERERVREKESVFEKGRESDSETVLVSLVFEKESERVSK